MALWVENEARRANRNLLLVNGGILAVIVLIIAGNYRYCANFVLGCPIDLNRRAGWHLLRRNNAGATLCQSPEQNP